MPKTAKALNYDPELLELLAGLLLAQPGVSRGQMMGHPCFYSPSRKIICCCMESGYMLKPAPADYEVLEQQEGVGPFAPMGQPMRGWLMVERESLSDVEDDFPLLLRALDYVESTAKKK
jgi:hypothetical protein